MGLSPILVIGDPSCARRRSLTQRPRHKRCRGGQRGDIHPGARFNVHPRAGHAVEHPERNFLPKARSSPVDSASCPSRARLLYDIADPDRATAPGMPRVKHPAGDGPMGGLAFGCTTRSARTAAWNTGRRLRRRSSCQAGRPAPLRSAGHPRVDQFDGGGSTRPGGRCGRHACRRGRGRRAVRAQRSNSGASSDCASAASSPRWSIRRLRERSEFWL